MFLAFLYTSRYVASFLRKSLSRFDYACRYFRIVLHISISGGRVEIKGFPPFLLSPPRGLLLVI